MRNNIFKEYKPFLKYCAVGVSGTLVDLASLYIFVEYLSIPVIPGTVLSFLLAVTNNFVFNKIWTFRSASKNYRKLYIKFLLVSTAGLGLTVGSMFLLVNIIGIWYLIAKALTSLIVLTWNFLVNKFWTFRLSGPKHVIPESFSYAVSVIVPAYNEASRIKQTLLIIHAYFKQINVHAEIIVVNDGSNDTTSDVVNGLKQEIGNLKLIDYGKNKGKGYAVHQGIKRSLGKLILFTDADNSTPIYEFEKLSKKMNETSAHIAIGSRYLKDSTIHIEQPRYRIFLGRIGNLLIRLFLIDDIMDTQCGFKLFKNEIAREVFSHLKVKRFAFDMEAITVAKHLGYTVVEVPVSWLNTPGSKVRPVIDALRTFRDLIYIKINLWSGRYSSD